MNDLLILVAEDERDIRELIVLTLQIDGFNVVEVRNGEEAIQKAVELKPDLILMDVRMPRITGYEACMRVKEDNSLKNIPLIFLSAKGQETEINAGLEAGADGYLLKPFSPKELTLQVNKFLVKCGKL